MVTTYSTNDFRANLREIINSLEYQGQTAIIQRYGKDVGAVIPQSDYDEYQRLKRDRRANESFANDEFTDITEELVSGAYTS